MNDVNNTVKTSKAISAQQLFALLIITRVSSIITESFSQNSSPINTALLLNILASCIMLLIFLLPVMLLRQLAPDENILQVLHRTFGTIPAAIGGTSIIGYFVFMTALYDARFICFAQTAIDPTIPAYALTVIFLMTCVYLANRGTEALARAAVILTPILLLAAVFAIVMSVQFSHIENALPGNLSFTTHGPLALQNISRNASIAAVGLLLPQVKGNVSKSLTAYIAVTTVISLMVVYMIVTIFGNFASELVFPFYTLASLRSDMVFFRPDVVISVAWLLGHLVQISIAFIAVMLVLRHFAPNWRKSLIIGSMAAVSAAASWVFDLHSSLSRFERALTLAGYGFIIVAVGLPFLAVLGHIIRRKDTTT